MLAENISSDGISVMDTSIVIVMLTSGLTKAQDNYWTDLQKVSERTEKCVSEQKRGSRHLWSCTLTLG